MIPRQVSNNVERKTAPSQFAAKRYNSLTAHAFKSEFPTTPGIVSVDEFFTNLKEYIATFIENGPGNTNSLEKCILEADKFIKLPQYQNDIQYKLKEIARNYYNQFRQSVQEINSLKKLGEECIRISRSIVFISTVFHNWTYTGQGLRSATNFYTQVLKECFEEDFTFLQQIKSLIISYLLNDVRKEEGQNPSKWAVDFFITIGYSDDLLEIYKNEIPNFFEENPIQDSNPATIVLTISQITMEYERSFSSFQHSFAKLAISAIRKEMIKKYIYGNLNSIFRVLFEERNADMLLILTQIVFKDGSDEFQNKFEKIWISSTKKFIDNSVSTISPTFSDDIFQFLDTLDRCSLEMPPNTAKILKRTIQKSLNDASSRVQYAVARFLHRELSKGSDVSVQMPHLERLLKLLDSPDDFLEYHHKYYGVRLLTRFGRPPSAEEQVVNRLKAIYGDEALVPFAKMAEDASEVSGLLRILPLNGGFILSPSTASLAALSDDDQISSDSEGKIDKKLNGSGYEIQSISDSSEKIERKVKINIDDLNKRHVREYALDVRFLVLDSRWWPRIPTESFPVPEALITARVAFEAKYRATHVAVRLVWAPLLDEVTFRYKGASFIGNAAQAMIMSALVEGKEAENAGVPASEFNDAVAALTHSGLTARIAGQTVLASFRPQKKLTRIAPVSCYAPKPPRRPNPDDIITSRHPKIAALIVRTLKRLGSVGEDALFAEVSEESVFNMTRSQYDACVASLLASETIVMSDRRKLRYIEEF